MRPNGIVVTIETEKNMEDSRGTTQQLCVVPPTDTRFAAMSVSADEEYFDHSDATALEDVIWKIDIRFYNESFEQCRLCHYVVQMFLVLMPQLDCGLRLLIQYERLWSIFNSISRHTHFDVMSYAFTGMLLVKYNALRLEPS